MDSADEVPIGLLQTLPPVEFCCVYGSSLHPNNSHIHTSMIDYILGVPDPQQWHAQVYIQLQSTFFFPIPMCFTNSLPFSFQESQHESPSLCIMDGPPWWSAPGYTLFLSSHSQFYFLLNFISIYISC